MKQNVVMVKRFAAIALAVMLTVAFMPIFSGGDGFAQAASKPGKVKGFSGTKTNQMVQLKWSKAKKAKKYRVYMKKGKSGKWKLKKTTKARKVKINGLKWKKTYYFKVRAVNGKKKGKASRVLYAKISSKRTVASYLSSSKCNELAGDMLDAVNGEYYVFEKCKLRVSGNTFTYSLYCDSAYDHDVWNANWGSTLGTSGAKKTMKKEIRKEENTIGIVGIKYKILIKDSSGDTVYSCSYHR